MHSPRTGTSNLVTRPPSVAGHQAHGDVFHFGPFTCRPQVWRCLNGNQQLSVASVVSKLGDGPTPVGVGDAVKEGDILIGKITPKGETDPSPEEKLLRAIFGDKAGDVKDASLRVSPSIKGVIVNKKLFSRVIKDKKLKAEEKPLVEKLDADHEKNNYNLKLKLVDKLEQDEDVQKVYHNLK